MTRMAAARTLTALQSQKKAVDAVVVELLEGGVDLRRVSLNEVKRRLSSQLKRRHQAKAPGSRTVA
jgi:hypothetical protein